MILQKEEIRITLLIRKTKFRRILNADEVRQWVHFFVLAVNEVLFIY